MNTKTQKLLISYIKKIVKEEVKNSVNEILAEHFLKTIGSNGEKSSLVETVFQKNTNVVAAKVNPEEVQKQREEFRQRAMKKLGITDEKQYNLIYGDVDTSGPSTAVSNGAYIDDSGDGVDLSVFGYK